MFKKTSSKVDEYLLRFHLFSQLYLRKGKGTFKEVSRMIRKVTREPGELLYSDAQNRNFVFVEQGSVALFTQKADDPLSAPTLYKRIGPNEYFGEKVLYHGVNKLHSAKAITRVQLL
jgi:CRP-like cAMP-binding protein